MFKRSTYNEAQAKIEALDRSLAIIEFSMDGHVLHANENFLRVMKYTLAELINKHHGIFVEDAEAKSGDYAQFWTKLKGGQYVTGEFLRLAKGGDRIWLEATYNPILDAAGKPVKVVKFASDISAKKNQIDRLMSMIDNMPVAVMTVDPRNNFQFDYLNQTSRKTLKPLEQYLPVKVDDMLEHSFDVFHMNPKHQRTMLSDASHLPHRTKIKVGPETLDLQVTAVNDERGNYIGPMATWSIVTAQVQMASEVTRVVEAVGSAIQEMQQSAEGLTQSADSARQKATSVAANSEQMNNAIQEISGQVGRVSERAQQIATQAEPTDATMRQLAENARKVDARGRHDQVDRRPDQPAGAQRHDRGGPCRHGRTRLRGGGQRGQGAGRADREGDRGDYPAGLGDPERDRRGGERHRDDHRGGGGTLQPHAGDGERRGGAGCLDPRDVGQYRRRLAGGQRDRASSPRRSAALPAAWPIIPPASPRA